VLLLGLAEETRRHHPALYSACRLRFQRRPVRDCEFHQALMRQIGSPRPPALRLCRAGRPPGCARRPALA
jgi:hypothetical protein